VVLASMAEEAVAEAVRRARIDVHGAIDIAEEFEGWNTPYVWGGKGRGGIDCSGLARACYPDLLPDGSENQARLLAGHARPEGRLALAEPGDLVFFGPHRPGEEPFTRIDHVALIVEGATAGQPPLVIHAASGQTVRRERLGGPRTPTDLIVLVAAMRRFLIRSHAESSVAKLLRDAP
jgi:cell wall-associated NlpC family hydrolase